MSETVRLCLRYSISSLREREGISPSKSPWFQSDEERLVWMAVITVPVCIPVSVSPSATDLARDQGK